jgi:hypothetical protein
VGAFEVSPHRGPLVASGLLKLKIETAIGSFSITVLILASDSTTLSVR